MKQSSEFDLNLWNLTHHDASCQKWYQAAFQHDLDMLHAHYSPSFMLKNLEGKKSQAFSSVDVVHLFACGYEKDNRRFVSQNVLTQLLSWGGRLDAPDVYGWLPINYACYFGLPQTLDVLLEAGSPVQNPFGPQPLDSALTSVAQSPRGPSETCARLLLFHGADPNMGLSGDPQWGGVTWLVWALLNERFDWAELLCRKGVKPLTEKECRLLILRASPEALVWAESWGMRILPFMAKDHHAYDLVHKAEILRQRRFLTEALTLFPASSSEKKVQVFDAGFYGTDENENDENSDDEGGGDKGENEGASQASETERIRKI